ncbi:peroxidase-like protein isoform X2 [Mytilus trossulus]
MTLQKHIWVITFMCYCQHITRGLNNVPVVMTVHSLADTIRELINEAANEVNMQRNMIMMENQMKMSPQTMRQETHQSTPSNMMYTFLRRSEDMMIEGAFGKAAEIAITATSKIEKRLKRPATSTDIVPLFHKFIEPYCPKRHIVCNPLEKYRTADGTCNNLHNPVWGTAITPQPRFLPPNYGDSQNLGHIPRILSVTGDPLPSPRLISNNVHGSGVNHPRSQKYTVALTHFGQFIDHDVISTPILIDEGLDQMVCCNGDQPVNRPECFPFFTPPGEFKHTCMEFVRSEAAPTTGCGPGPRHQMNQRTSYLDLSQVYGNNIKAMRELRTLHGGEMQEGAGGLLPDGPPDLDCVEGQVCFRAGDHRHSDAPTLNVIHVLFLREHNRIARGLQKINLHWGDEKIYQETKKILDGMYQHIIYNEYLPAILGEEIVTKFGIRSTARGYNNVYDPKVDGSTRNVFAAAVFRIGHTQIESFVGFMTPDYAHGAQTPVVEEFFNTRLIRGHNNMYGVDGIARWMCTHFQGAPDSFITHAVRDRLFETEPGNGFDLPALNMQRARDHGIPSYNKWREFCGLKPALHFGVAPMGLIDHDPRSAKALQLSYSHPNDIDIFPGALSEVPMPGSLLGPTFQCLFSLQFLNFKVGDRFYYENDFKHTGFTPGQLNTIKQQRLSSLFMRNMQMSRMQHNAFVSPLSGPQRHGHEMFPPLDLNFWREIVIHKKK